MLKILWLILFLIGVPAQDFTYFVDPDSFLTPNASIFPSITSAFLQINTLKGNFSIFVLLYYHSNQSTTLSSNVNVSQNVTVKAYFQEKAKFLLFANSRIVLNEGKQLNFSGIDFTLNYSQQLLGILSSFDCWNFSSIIIDSCSFTMIATNNIDTIFNFQGQNIVVLSNILLTGILNSKNFIYGDCFNLSLTNSVFSNLNGTAFAVLMIESDSFSLVGNDFETIYFSSASNQYFYMMSSTGIISSNYFKDFNASSAAIFYLVCTSTILTNNTFTFINIGNFMIILKLSQNISLSNCTFTDIIIPLLLLSDLGYINVSGLIIVNCNSPIITQEQYKALPPNSPNLMFNFSNIILVNIHNQLNLFSAGIINIDLQSAYTIYITNIFISNITDKYLNTYYLITTTCKVSSVSMSNLTFAHNTYLAGAILVVADSFSLVDSVFLNNTNLQLDLMSITANVIIQSNLTLRLNQAYATGIDVIPANKVTFQNFKASLIRCGNNSVALFGGCYHFRPTYQGNYSFSDSTIENCASAYVSGALDVFCTLPTYQTCFFSLKNISFFNNTAAFQGGAASFFFHDNYYVVLIINCSFTSNSAAKGGAVILNLDNPDNHLNISNSSFLLNQAQTGASLSMISGRLAIVNTLFKGNQGLRGGALECTNSNTAFINLCNFSNNTATRYGGVFLLLDRSTAEIIETQISTFNAAFGGIAYLDSNSALTLESSDISNGTGRIGALIYMSHGQLNFTRIKLISISALVSLLFLDHSDVIFNNVDFKNTQSTIFDLNNVNFKALNLQIFDVQCGSTNQEGCVFGARDASRLQITNLMVKNLQGVNKGGIFYLIEAADLNFCNSSFINIINSRAGSLIYNEYSKTVLSNSKAFNISWDLVYGYQASIWLDNLRFENPPFSNQMSYLNIDSSQFLNISNSIFLGLITKTNGGLLYLSNEENIKLSSVIINSTFTNIQSLGYGGTIYIENTNLVINSSIFSLNSAVNGGCIYFQCDDGFICNLGIFSNQFLNNYAANHGGVIKWAYQKPLGIPTNVFLNNTAANYGNDRASFPIKLAVRLYNTSNSSQVYFTMEQSLNYTLHSRQAQSGQKLDFSMEFYLIDEEDQLIRKIGLAKLYIDILASTSINELSTIRSRFNISKENAAKIVNYTSNAMDIAGQTSQNIDETTWSFSFDDLTITAKPATTVFLKVTSLEISKFRTNLFPSDGSYPLNHVSLNDQYIYYIPMNISSCVPGEIYDGTTNTCYRCPKGTYSYFIFDETCKNCLDHADCPGANLMAVEDGYWRSSNTSENIYRCSAMLFLCQGGINSTCMEGYKGRLCEVCEDINGNPANKNYFGLCQECANIGTNILISIPMAIGVLIILKLLAKYVSRTSEKKDENRVINVSMIKLLVMHYQMLTLIPNVNTSFGQTPNQILGGLTRNWFSYDCIFGMAFGFPNELDNRMISITLLLILFAAGSNYVLYHWKKRYSRKILNQLFKIKDFILNRLRLLYLSPGTNKYIKARSNQQTPSITVVKQDIEENKKKKMGEKLVKIITYNSIWLYLIQTSMMDLSFLGMRCVEIDGVSYSRYSLDYECWSADHILWVIFLYVPNILLWTVGLTWVMYKWLGIVKKITMKNTLIASVGFKKKYRLWGDVMYLLRKTIVIVINTFSNENSETIPFTIFLLMSSLLLWHFYSRPYSFKILNNLDAFSLYIVFTTYYTLSYYYTSIDAALANFFYALLIAMHIVWAALWLIVFFRKRLQTLLRRVFKLNKSEIYPKS